MLLVRVKLARRPKRTGESDPLGTIRRLEAATTSRRVSVSSGLRANRHGASMQQIADWLQKLGLGQYVDRFAENDIDFAVLADLTDQDLEKIGVASLGHRRKLLRAIGELKGALEPSTAAVAPVAPHDTAERRQVTVMF